MHLIKWDTLTLPKECGGLGIKDLSLMNKSCMMKLAWNLNSGQSKLWCKVLEGKYERGSSLAGEIQVKVTDSFIWKAICDCTYFIKDNQAWSLGNGS